MSKEEKFNSVYDVLRHIQVNLHAPKSQFNKFGNYNYRNVEDIQEGLKKILPEGAACYVSDEIVDISGRIYVKATASLCYGDKCVSNSAYAREPVEQKGMSPSQVTGSASSYARKYALGGLFMVDDQKDADSDERAKQADNKADAPKPKAQAKPLSGEEFLMLQNGLKNANSLDDLKNEWIKSHTAKARMTDKQYETLEKVKNAKKTELENRKMDGSHE
jgi:hypothetical protein